MPARFRLFDNGGRSADRYFLIDAKPDFYDGKPWRTGLSMNANPHHPQGIGMTNQYDARDWAAMTSPQRRGRLGKRIKVRDLPSDAQRAAVDFMCQAGAKPHELRTAGTNTRCRKGKRS